MSAPSYAARAATAGYVSSSHSRTSAGSCLAALRRGRRFGAYPPTLQVQADGAQWHVDLAFLQDQLGDRSAGPQGCGDVQILRPGGVQQVLEMLLLVRGENATGSFGATGESAWGMASSPPWQIGGPPAGDGFRG